MEVEEEVKVKRCSKCGETKALGEFYRHKTTGKVDSWCHECKRLDTLERGTAKRNGENPNRRVPAPFLEDGDGNSVAAKTCSRCGETKSLAEFGSHGKHLASWCKTCRNADAVVWRATPEGKEKTRAHNKAWKAKHPRKSDTWPVDDGFGASTEGKRCSRCGQEKPIANFRKLPPRKGVEKPLKEVRYESWCQDCVLDYSRCNRKRGRSPEAIARHRESDRQRWAVMSPEERYERNRASRLRNRFGITVADYKDLQGRQSNVCAICGHPEPYSRELAVDHDHDTGYIRGLLCANCNLALGFFNDNLEIMQAARRYLYQSAVTSSLSYKIITDPQKQELLQTQLSKCAICGSPHTAEKPLLVDHDHESGLVRGLLCFNCNVGLGRFGDTEPVLSEAIAYLRLYAAQFE